jgi:hypothetical protein
MGGPSYTDATKAIFGKPHADATNSMLDGKVVATGTPGATEVKDPNMGLSNLNRFSRSMMRGVGSGLQQWGQAQNGWRQGTGGAAPDMQQPQQPQLGAAAYGQGTPEGMLPWAQNTWPGLPGKPGVRSNSNMLYGG